MDELMDSDSSQSDASEDGQIIDTEKKTEIIVDGEKDLINLRRTIYLVVMSSVDYNECCHKLLKLLIREE